MPEIATVGVAGSGTMGAGIAIVAARAGFRTIVFDVSADALARARKQSEGFLEQSVKRGKLKDDERRRILADLAATSRIEDMAQCDIVIEATSVPRFGCPPGLVGAPQQDVLDLAPINCRPPYDLLDDDCGQVIRPHAFQSAAVSPKGRSDGRDYHRLIVATVLRGIPFHCGLLYSSPV